MTRRAAVVIGTRPEAIKLAPVVRALREEGTFTPWVIATGQHRQMLDQALRVFDLRPDVDLELMAPGQTLPQVTSRALEGLHRLFEEQCPEWVIVQGDTTTALAAALAAFYRKTKVAHVEAGLRSGERYAPFPEEINRRLVDQLSDVLFAPTAAAAGLLANEGYTVGQIVVTGNTVVDALLLARAEVQKRGLGIPGVALEALAGRRLLLVTAHRRESFGAGVLAICRALRRIADDEPDVAIVYPVHLNPQIDGPVRALLGGHPRIHLPPPFDYLGFVAALERAHLVLTDSGGVQEEAPTFGKPLLVLREVTERPEGVAAGVARLAGTSEERIYEESRRLLGDGALYARMSTGANPYGDGRAARRIVDALRTRSLAESAGQSAPMQMSTVATF